MPFDMKPYLREKKIKGSFKRDCHPKKGLMNWWEDFNNFISRRKSKQQYKRNLNDELNNDT